MTNRLLKAVVLASTMWMVGMAQSTTIKFEGDDWRDSALLAPSMQLSLFWSSEAMDRLQVMGAVPKPVSPAVRPITGRSMDVSWPVSEMSVTGRGDGLPIDLTYVASNGALSMTMSKDNFATSGGTLTLSDVTIDFTRRQILADISGGNGLGTHQDVPVWTYAYVNEWGSISSPSVIANCVLTIDASCTLEPQVTQLLGLTITPTAFDLFSQGLGLREGGRAVVSSITDFGVLTLSPVPEPSTCALMILGLMGLPSVVVKRRRQCVAARQITAA